MEATSVNWETGKMEISKIELEQLHNKSGLDISDINQVVADENGLLIYKDYKDRPVILYIRDTQEVKNTVLKYPKETRRFHLADCTTLEQMRSNNRFERYRITYNTSGVFIVDVYESKYSDRIEEIEAKLLVCKNCLAKLKYKGFDQPSYIPHDIWVSFDIEEFLMFYKPMFRTKPKFTDQIGPKSEYPKDWSQISQKLRENFGWRCNKCNLYFGDSQNRKLLHVHHRDGNKGNTSPLNLVPLCLECHSNEPMQGRLRFPKKNKLGISLIQKLRNEKEKSSFL
jgi:hypothetical protein